MLDRGKKVQVASCTSPSERSDSSLSSSSKEIPSSPSPQTQPPSQMRLPSWADIPARPPLPFPVFDYKEGSRSTWKFREAPRLSLDSRVDGKGNLFPCEIKTVPVSQSDESDASDSHDKQRRSPSVVARLMGLDALPGNADVRGTRAGADGESYKRAELRRSASESRASRDRFHYQFVDGSSCFQRPPPPANVTSEDRLREVRQSIVRDTKPKPLTSRLPLPACPPPHPTTAFCALQRKSFFDVQDYFVSELRKRTGTGSLYGEIEKRLRMRGIDEPAKDLETLKQILEAIQLKGLLHSRQQLRDGLSEVPHQPNGRNFVYEQSPMRENCYDSPIVVMQAALRSLSERSPPTSSYPRSNASPSPPRRRSQLAPSETASRFPRQNHAEIGRNISTGSNEVRGRGARTPDPIKARISPSPVRRLSPSVSAGGSRPSTDRRTSCAHSPKGGSPRKAGSDPATRSPRNSGRPTSIVSTMERISPRPEEDEFTGSGGGGFSVSSHFDFERVKSEYRDGKILLERCDKLLNSIAEITSKAAADDEEEQVNATEQQPSPVSVLDAAASFNMDVAGASPSPVLSKRCIDFKDQLAVASGTEILIPSISTAKSDLNDRSEMGGGDFSYVSEILWMCDPYQTAENSFWQPEAQQRMTGAADSSTAFPLHRKVVFDAVSEIVDRRRQVSPWEAFLRSRSPVASEEGMPLPGEVWAELLRIQEHAPADDLCEVICGVLRKDMTAASTAERAWSGRPVEMSDAVLDIERLIFKDLVGDTITQLAAFLEGRRQGRAAERPSPSAAAAVQPRRRLLF